MSMDLMRSIIAAVYTGDNWKRKVACMDDCQVIAVYNSFLARGLIGKTVEYEPPKGMDRLTEIIEEKVNKRESYGDNAVQLSIYDLLMKGG